MSDLDKRLKVDVDYKSISQRGPTFTDSKFPANNFSLGKGEEIDDAIKKGVKWRRAPEIFKSLKLFRGIDLNDVIQGDLGVCYYISAITGVSESPKRILKLFLVEQENKHGCYAVNLYVSGALRTIVIDDLFPAYRNEWAFTHSKEEEIWVMVLEKAWAKVHGNYGVTSGGDSRESLSSLTGFPTTLVQHKNISKSDLWKLLFEANKRNYVMSTGGAQQTRGLYSGHAYTLLNAVEVNTRTGNDQLVQIRNPWGEYEWNGDWSDKSTRWTSELRSQVGHIDADDGTFFMSINDFYNMYSYSFICQYIDSYIRNDLIVNEHEACVAFQVTAETKGFFSAYQMSARLTGARSCKILFVELYAYRDQRLNLVKVANGEIKQLDFSRNPANSNAIGMATIEAILPPGLYVMHAFYQNNDAPSVKYICFVANASKSVDLIHLKGKTSVKSITKADLTNAIENYIESNNIDLPEKKGSSVCINISKVSMFSVLNSHLMAHSSCNISSALLVFTIVTCFTFLPDT